jgi:hypothetical protein
MTVKKALACAALGAALVYGAGVARKAYYNPDQVYARVAERYAPALEKAEQAQAARNALSTFRQKLGGAPLPTNTESEGPSTSGPVSPSQAPSMEIARTPEQICQAEKLAMAILDSGMDAGKAGKRVDYSECTRDTEPEMLAKLAGKFAFLVAIWYVSLPLIQLLQNLAQRSSNRSARREQDEEDDDTGELDIPGADTFGTSGRNKNPGSSSDPDGTSGGRHDAEEDSWHDNFGSTPRPSGRGGGRDPFGGGNSSPTY